MPSRGSNGALSEALWENGQRGNDANRFSRGWREFRRKQRVAIVHIFTDRVIEIRRSPAIDLVSAANRAYLLRAGVPNQVIALPVLAAAGAIFSWAVGKRKSWRTIHACGRQHSISAAVR